MARRASRADLQRRLAECEPFIPLAREIGAAAAHLAVEDITDPERLSASLGDAVTRLTGREKQRLVVEAFTTLPATERIKLLVGVFDESTLRIALEAERVKASRSAVADLAEIARDTGGVDLTLLPFRARMDVMLCDKATFDNSYVEDLIDDCDAAHNMRLAHLGQGRFHLLDQTKYLDRSKPGDTIFYPEISDQQVLELGCLLNARTPSEQLEKTIYLGATLGSSIDTGRKFSAVYPDHHEELLVVGHMSVNGTCILGDHNPVRPTPQTP